MSTFGQQALTMEVSTMIGKAFNILLADEAMQERVFDQNAIEESVVDNDKVCPNWVVVDIYTQSKVNHTVRIEAWQKNIAGNWKSIGFRIKEVK